MSRIISTEELKAAAHGAATQCNEAFARTLKAMIGHAIEIAEDMNRRAATIYNMNMSLQNKRDIEPEKSVKKDDEPNNIRSTPTRR